MLHLPVELVISILNYLPLSTISSLLSTSREWNNFCEANQSILYHNAAVLHGFTPSSSIVYSDLGAALSRRSLTGVSDWKSFCASFSSVASNPFISLGYTQTCIQKSWRGEAASFVTSHRCAGDNVHRVKVDEQRGFIVTTSWNGGLVVADLSDDKVLWSLPEVSAQKYTQHVLIVVRIMSMHTPTASMVLDILFSTEEVSQEKKRSGDLPTTFK